MTEIVFEKAVRIDRPTQEVFSWLERPGALERLCPPWEKVRVVRTDGSLKDGSQVEIESIVCGIRQRWLVEHRDYQEDVQFRDVQLKGPFPHWEHLHRVESGRPSETEHSDRIVYRAPGGPLAPLVSKYLIQGKLTRMFRYRHAVMKADLELAGRHGAVRKLRIAIAGASGFVGRALIPFLTTQGHEVVRLVRGRAAADGEISWEPEAGVLDPHALRGVDVIINLCGASLVDGRWTKARKDELWWSRIHSTRTLVNAIEAAKHRPFLLINASAIGFYGSRGDERLTEESAPGAGFLAELCDAWEAEALRAESLGIRVVTPRLGVVLSPDGGALAKLLTPFRLGVGGPAGPSRHWLSWISRDDVLGALYHCIVDQRCRGPVNFTAPEPVRQGLWARELGRSLRRPAIVPVPSFALRLLFGEMADEALLASTRVLPGKLVQFGYEFRHRSLDEALAHCLGTVMPTRRGTNPGTSAGANASDAGQGKQARRRRR
ncbi:TIGR01777 family oxidoreductase [Nibricoccus sp. IMCC34717]|uniref:TIGR01777 family oxidoreductase n=1 Tax=Nibricoccus sp. IMCC34717 TaxID=3034021 RepID=UPI00384F917E